MKSDNADYVDLLLIGVSSSTAKALSEGRKITRRGRKPTEEQQKKIITIVGVDSYEDLLEDSKIIHGQVHRKLGSPYKKLLSRADSPFVKFKELFGSSTDEVYEIIVEAVLNEMKRGEKGSTVEILRSYLNSIEEEKLVSSLSNLLED